MKNIVLIFAGGSGARMNSVARPKQFLSLHGKEIIIHTIEKFENHPMIDGIVIVCIADWIEHLKKILQTFHIKKVLGIVPGGETGQESIYNGLQEIHNQKLQHSIVLVHDGVRPLITEELITSNIKMAAANGSAVTVSPAIETIVSVDVENKVQTITDRATSYYAKAPQTFKFTDLWAAHIKAKNEKLNNFIDSASLMKHYGFDIYTVSGPSENIKITNPSDFYMFRALFDAKENSQIFGL